MPTALITPRPQLAPDAPLAGGALDWSQVGWEHALLIARGAIDDGVLAEFQPRITALVAAGVRYLVADLSQVSSCSPGVVAELAQGCRIFAQRDGWLRSVATAACVTDALEQADVTDLLTVYQASLGTAQG